MPEIEFRDGKRGVPEHVAALLVGVPTYKLTYSEAQEFINLRLENNHVQKAMDKVVNDSLRRFG